ncbi:hypothetical protein BH09ACT12_BH09ACT12_15800 [soil metagenome]
MVAGSLAVPLVALGAAPASATASCVATDRPLGAATGYTEFIAGNGHRGSESEGAIAWGGNLDANGMTVGTRLNSDKADATLIVAGTHGQYFNLQRGSAYVTPQSGVNFNGGGSYLASNPVDFTDAFTELTSRSTSWGAATANGTAALGMAGGQQYLVLTGTDPDLNVFSVTPAQLVSGNGIAYDVPAGSGVLVNVSGTDVTLAGQMWMKESGSFNQVNDNVMARWPGILWNFPSATTITMNFGSAWGGSILAPKATLNVTSVGHTIGQMIAKSFSSNYETHQNLYPSTACLPPTSTSNPSVHLDKTASAINDLDGNGPDAGDTITYSFKVTNTGNVTLNPVTVTDPMFGSVTCTPNSLAPTASVSCAQKTYTLKQSDVNAGKVDNTATATGTPPSGPKVDDDDSTSTTVAPWTVSVGDFVFKDVNGDGIQDTGDTGISGVELTLVGPGGGSVTSVYGFPVAAQTTDSNGAYLFKNLPVLPSGQHYTVKVDNSQTALAAYTPTQTGQGTAATDSSTSSAESGNLTVKDASDLTLDFGFVVKVTPNPAIQLDKSASAIDDLDGNGPDEGDTITYSFKVTNTGNVALDPVTVADPMFTTAITCPTGPLAPGASVDCSQKTYTITAADVAAGKVDNTATATGTPPSGPKVTDPDSTSTPVVPVVTGPSNLKVTKTVSDNAPHAGDTITYTLKVTNDGDSAATGVTLTDVLPSGVSFVSAAAPCTRSGSTISCDVGTIPAGGSRTATIKVAVDAITATGPVHQHQVDVQKSEVHIDLEAGQTRTVTTSCQAGYIVMDGSGRIDAVDQGTGTLASVKMTESRAIGNDTWQVTLTNQATGRAQGKVFSVCLKKDTETINGNTHQIVTGDPVVTTVPLPAGRTDVALTCAPGQTPIQPGYLLDGVAYVPTSYPSGVNGWTFSVISGQATSGTFSIRCLDNVTSTSGGHNHALDLFEVTQDVTVPAGQVSEITLACGDAKGIVAGYDLDSGLVNLGNDPRPVIRVFKLYNPTSGPLHAKLRLLCLGIRTKGNTGSSGVVTNTATASTASVEASYGDNSDSATFTIDTSSTATPFASGTVTSRSVVTTVKCSTDGDACRGRATLVAVKRMKVDGTVVRKGSVLARTSYRVASGKKARITLKSTRSGKHALASKRLKKARLKIDGGTRVIRLRH